MPWIIGFKKARELLYLGDMIDAPTALELGMVNRVVPRGDLSEDTLKFAQRMALIAPEALATTKLAINRGADAAGFRNAMQAGIDVVAPALCRANRGRNPVPRARPQGRIRRVEMAQGSVRNVTARDSCAVFRE